MGFQPTQASTVGGVPGTVPGYADWGEFSAKQFDCMAPTLPSKLYIWYLRTMDYYAPKRGLSIQKKKPSHNKIT